MSQLDLFIRQVKQYLGIPEAPVPIRIEREDRDDSHQRLHDEKRCR